MLRVGWDWEQEWETTDETETGRPEMKYYRIAFQPYYELQGYIQSKLDIRRLWYWEFTADLKKYYMSYFFSLLFNGDFYICPGMGWSSDPITFELTTSMKFMDCHKTIIKDLCDFSSNWTGYKAKWIDECDKSSDAFIELKKWDILDHTEDVKYMRWGTVYPESHDFCHPLPGISENPIANGYIRESSAISTWAKMAYTAVGNYYYKNYGP